MVPSFFAPIFTVMSALGALPVQRCSCLRSSISLTGAPAFFASRHATMAKALPLAEGPSLLPKPPPMCSQMHAHVLAVDPERLGDALAHREDALGRGVDR